MLERKSSALIAYLEQTEMLAWISVIKSKNFTKIFT
jgi:hypothetical protein